MQELRARVQLGYTVDVYGVESICRVLPIASSTYYRHAQKLQQPTLRVKRCVSDACLLAQIQTVWNDGLQVYGSGKCGANYFVKVYKLPYQYPIISFHTGCLNLSEAF